MRIAFVSQHYGQAYRGAETFIHELSTNLRKIGHEVTIINSVFKIPKETQIVIPIDGRWQAITARIWAWMHGAKIIISGQSGLGIDDKINLWTLPDAFVGLTDYQCQWAKKFNPLIKIVKIPNGVDTNKFNPKVKPMTIDLPRPIVLNVAALESIKRQDLLIQAVSETKASLLIVGKGSLQDKIKDLGCRMLGEKRFKILNFSHEQMPGIYTACDLFAFTSAPWESFGIAILEAKACGLPVVVTPDPIRQEILNSKVLTWAEIATFYEKLFYSL